MRAMTKSMFTAEAEEDFDADVETDSKGEEDEGNLEWTISTINNSLTISTFIFSTEALL